jgi:hypothetical protein
LVLELYRGHELVALRAQIDTLRRDVDSLKHGVMEEDLLEQLRAFEDAVSTSRYFTMVQGDLLKQRTQYNYCVSGHLSVPHRKHTTSPLRVQQVHAIYSFVMIY